MYLFSTINNHPFVMNPWMTAAAPPPGEWVSVIKAGDYFQASELRTKEAWIGFNGSMGYTGHKCIYIYVYVKNVYICTQIFIFIHTCMYTYKYIHVLHTYMYIYICSTCVYIYIHTLFRQIMYFDYAA